MDLSTRAAKRLRLDDFLKQNLVEAPARYLIEWVDSREGIFRILWTHQSSGDFNTCDAALFRYWAIARGKSPDGLSSVDLKQSLRMALNKSPSVQKLPSVHDDRYYRYFRVRAHILSEWWKEYPQELEKFSPGENNQSTLKSPTDYTRPCLPSRVMSPPFARSLNEENSSMNVQRFLDHPSSVSSSSTHREPGQLFRPYALDQMDHPRMNIESQTSESLLLLDEKDYSSPNGFSGSLCIESESKNLYMDSQCLLPDGGYYSSSGSSPGSSSFDDISKTTFLNSQSYLLPEGVDYSSPRSSPGSSSGEDKPRKMDFDLHSLILPEQMGYSNDGAHSGVSSRTEEDTLWDLRSEDPTHLNRCEWVTPTLSSPSGDLINSSKHRRGKRLETKVRPTLASCSLLDQQSLSCSPNTAHFPDNDLTLWSNACLGIADTKNSTFVRTESETTCTWDRSYLEREQYSQVHFQSL